MVEYDGTGHHSYFFRCLPLYFHGTGNIGKAVIFEAKLIDESVWCKGKSMIRKKSGDDFAGPFPDPQSRSSPFAAC